MRRLSKYWSRTGADTSNQLPVRQKNVNTKSQGELRPKDDSSFEDAVVLITGAGSGT